MDRVTKASAPAPAKTDPLPLSPDWSGKNLGDFHLLRRLGQGGMGQVYLAEQISLKRKVAIKMMRTDLAVSAVSLQRFEAEAKAIARVNHAISSRSTRSARKPACITWPWNTSRDATSANS